MKTMLGKLRAGESKPYSKPPNDTPLAKYLRYYEALIAPEYAVLVTGTWGTGKTYQVMAAIPEHRRYYISLYGVQSASDISAAVFGTMFPMKAIVKEKTGDLKAAAVLGIPVGAVGQQLANFFISETVKTDRTIIFDDLERSKLDPTELLGLVNRYVEHHKCRVVVIAHDGKLKEGFSEQKEKLFGREIKVQPDVDAAYTAFSEALAQNLNSGSSDALAEFRKDIIGIYHESECASLRILRHVMEDIVRLVACLSPTQREHQSALLEAICLVAALSFESRGERMTREDIPERDTIDVEHELFSAKDGTTLAPLVAAAKRYNAVKVGSNLLSSETLEAILFDGVFDASAIQSDVGQSIYFADAEQVPAWKTFIQFQSELDEVALPAMAKLQQQFEERAITEPGEMLHLFSLRLMMAEHRLISRTTEQVRDDCFEYITDLFSSRRLPPTPLKTDFASFLRNGSGGNSYWVEDPYSLKFQEIFDRLKEARAEALERDLPGYAAQLLPVIESDGRQLFEMLNHTGKGSGKFADVPVLVHIKPEQFAAAWLQAHPREWYYISNAVGQRFKNDHRGRFKQEYQWAENVRSLLLSAMESSTPLSALRMERVLRNIPDMTTDTTAAED